MILVEGKVAAMAGVDVVLGVPSKDDSDILIPKKVYVRYGNTYN